MFDKFRAKVADKIAPKSRAQIAQSRLREEANLIPLLNMDDTDSRRQDIKDVLTEQEVMDILFEPIAPKPDLNKMSHRAKQIYVKMEFVRKTAKKLYALFFFAGNPYYRGLDNRELAEKVAFFLMNYTEVGHLPKFVPDLFEEAMQLLSLSWQAKDVTHTPFYIVESTKPNIVTPFKGQPSTEFDATGLMEMQHKIEELTEKLEAQAKQ